MPFHTDLTDNDVLSITCRHEACSLAKMEIIFSVVRKTASKIRVTIDADPDLKIVKTQKTRKVPDDRKRRKPD